MQAEMQSIDEEMLELKNVDGPLDSWHASFILWAEANTTYRYEYIKHIRRANRLTVFFVRVCVSWLCIDCFNLLLGAMHARKSF